MKLTTAYAHEEKWICGDCYTNKKPKEPYIPHNRGGSPKGVARKSPVDGRHWNGKKGEARKSAAV